MTPGSQRHPNQLPRRWRVFLVVSALILALARHPCQKLSRFLESVHPHPACYCPCQHQWTQLCAEELDVRVLQQEQNGAAPSRQSPSRVQRAAQLANAQPMSFAVNATTRQSATACVQMWLRADCELSFMRYVPGGRLKHVASRREMQRRAIAVAQLLLLRLLTAAEPRRGESAELWRYRPHHALLVD